MSLLKINAINGVPVLADNAPHSLSNVLEQTLQETAVGRGPVVVMVHGYKYAPGHALHCPHETLFSLTPKHRELYPRAVSWPRHLGFGRDRQDRGLAISFGWPARGTFRSTYEEAAEAGTAFSRLLGELKRASPGRPVHAIAHSLGARVVLDGVSKSQAGSLDLALLLAPVEFAARAQRALETPGGQAARCLTVSTRENDVFDLIAMLGLGPSCHGTRMIGYRGLEGENCATLRIDHAQTLEALRSAGYRIAPPAGRICHWSSYLRPGLFRLYRSLISGELGLPRLRRMLEQQDIRQPDPGPSRFGVVQA